MRAVIGGELRMGGEAIVASAWSIPDRVAAFPMTGRCEGHPPAARSARRRAAEEAADPQFLLDPSESCAYVTPVARRDGRGCAMGQMSRLLREPARRSLGF